MKIQSAGRLGNTLFLWAFALRLSKENKINISIFTDKFHSDVGIEANMTRTLLSEPGIRFYNSDFLGLLLTIIDWVSSRSVKLGRVLKKFLGISDEWDTITSRTHIIRGYFQNSDFVLKNKALVADKLLCATYSVEQGSEKVRYLKTRYPQYQVVHIRLGDFLNSDFGVISPESYISAMDPIIPTLICTDGSQEEIIRMIDFSFEEILTPATLSAWETLCIMQGAVRFIGVNSTLSWWGAFLAISRGNLAFLPDQWIKSDGSRESKLLDLQGCTKYEAHFI